MDKYNESAKKLISDKKLSQDEVKLKLDNLIEEKNKQLALLLNDEQFKKSGANY